MGFIIFVAIIAFIVYHVVNSSKEEKQEWISDIQEQSSYMTKLSDKRDYSTEAFEASNQPTPSGDYYTPLRVDSVSHRSFVDVLYKCQWRGSTRCAYCFRRNSRIEGGKIYYGESSQCQEEAEYDRD